MDIIFVLKALAGLVVILTLLIILFIYPNRQKKKAMKKKKNITSSAKPSFQKHSLESILSIVKNKKSSQEELSKAIDLLIKYYSKIPAKLGIRAHPDFDIYEEIILRLCHHPHTSKDIILRLDRVLQKENPSYVRELNNALTKGLNARGM